MKPRPAPVLRFNPATGLYHGRHLRRGEFTVAPALVEAEYQAAIALFSGPWWDYSPEQAAAAAWRAVGACSRWTWRVGLEAGINWYQAAASAWELLQKAIA